LLSKTGLAARWPHFILSPTISEISLPPKISEISLQLFRLPIRGLTFADRSLQSFLILLSPQIV
jgi:hypothetical protein